MVPDPLRLIMSICIIFYFGSSMAGELGVGAKRIVIPFSLTAGQLPAPQSNGAQLFVSYCSQCHNLPSPKMHSTGDWPIKFESMMDHALLMARVSPDIKMPVDKEKKEIVSYLERYGFRGLPENSPLRGDPRVFNVIWFCSVCHAVPDPAQFPAKEWGSIVDRMNAHRKTQGREEMSNSDRNAIVNFLENKR